MYVPLYHMYLGLCVAMHQVVAVIAFGDGMSPDPHQDICSSVLTMSAWGMQCDTVKEGEVFNVETQDWTGGQIKDDDSAEDMKNINLTLVGL